MPGTGTVSVFKWTDGEKLRAQPLFFYIGADGKEYLVYAEEDGTACAAPIRKGRAGWRLQQRPVPEEVQAQIRSLLEWADCVGEAYRLTDRDGAQGYRRVRGAHRLEMLEKGAGRRWPYVLAAALCLLLAVGLTWLWQGVGPVESQTDAGFEARLAALPDETEYLTGLLDVLNEERWARLSETEKQGVLQQVCDWETTAVLGCSACTVQVDDLESGTLGHYNKADEAIAVSRTALAQYDWQTMVGVICHETRHAWQRDMIALLEQMEKNGESPLLYLNIFTQARDFREAWLNYTSGLYDYETYYNQIIESDSRQWSEQRMSEYYLPMIFG